MEIFLVIAAVVGLFGGYAGATATSKKKIGSAAEKAEKELQKAKKESELMVIEAKKNAEEN